MQSGSLERPKGDIPRPRSGAVAQEEIPYIQGQEQRPWGDTPQYGTQGKEQQLCFVGAALKRYPTSKVRETPVRQ